VISSQLTGFLGSVAGYNSVNADTFFRLHLMQDIMQEIRNETGIKINALFLVIKQSRFWQVCLQVEN
jgi:hypothetical protein